MIEASSGQNAVLALAAPSRASNILILSTGWDFQHYWLIPHGHQGSANCEENGLLKNGDCLNDTAHALTGAVIGAIEG